MPVSSFLEHHAAAWQAATRHSFLAGVRDGWLSSGALGRWLVQDYWFVRDLLTFQARLAARAPRTDQAVLIGGLGALEAELGWFETHAARFGLDLATPYHETTTRYRELLIRLDEAAYPVAITALWAIERAYQEAWTFAKPGAPQFSEFVDHWTDPGFITYVDGLERAANVAVDGSSEVEAAFLDVVRLETAFWEIATA